MQCLIPTRRYATYDPLVQLFKKLTITAIEGRNATTTAMVSCGLVTTTSYYYVLSIYNQKFTIWRQSYSGGIVGASLISTASTSGVRVLNSNMYLTTGTGFSTITTSSTVRTGAIAKIDFAGFSDADVIALLSAATVTTLAGKSSSTQSAVSTTDKTHKLIIAQKANALDIRKGGTWEKIAGTATDAATISGSTLTLGSVYGGTIIGID